LIRVGIRFPMPRPPSPAAREAWSIMETLVQDYRRDADVRVHELGVAPRQAKALRRLDPDAPIAMSRLAEALHCDNSNVTQIVDRLEADGLVERRPAPHDRRVKTLVLTDEGRRIRAEVERRMTEPPPLLAALRGEDARLLRDALRRMVDRD
jgi:MarR family transcriptional regulator, organic hydroperoxide resistance regulator